MESTDLATQAALVAALCEPGCLGSEGPVRVLETHISYVLLTGSFAYKIKKAVKLPFLDFSTLAARRHFCEEELRLNRRLAPELYLDVVPITGTPAHPKIGGGAGPALEYAVRMREFAQEGLLCNVLERDQLTPELVDALAGQVAEFHAGAQCASSASGFGEPSKVLATALANFAELLPRITTSSDRLALRALRTWTLREHAAIRAALGRRRDAGAVRECHGDLHLGNITLVGNRITIFDCLEFNEQMRWTDTMSEVAFTVMDLEHRGGAHLARRFLSAYLERCGDYAGMRVLRFYLVYRALVRAKVAILRAAQLPEGGGRTPFHTECSSYVRLAAAYAEGGRAAVVLMHGLSGCGKTTVSQVLLEHTGAVRVRTDVERKRLHGLAAEARSRSTPERGLYRPDATRLTYEHVLACATAIVQGGFVALVDGAFLARWQRDLFRDLAAAQHVPLVIVDCVASAATLQARVAARASTGKDASEADLAVLALQMTTAAPLTTDELPFTVACSTERPRQGTPASQGWRKVVERIDAPRQPSPGTAGDSRPDPQLAEKVAFLAQPPVYGEGVATVEPVETHMSWVFLTDHHAYKLKKPVRNAFVDLHSAAARHRNCLEEVRVNGRFSADVYLGVVPVTRVAGRLHIEGHGEVVDWLVHMRRLPANRMLDRVILSGNFDPACLTAVVALLCRIYHDSTRVVPVAEYRARLSETAACNQLELCSREWGLPRARVAAICERQLEFLARTACLDDRVHGSRIVEGHGDLRPEHICLEDAPQIIDALEFSRELRTADAADELGFLALECERLGAPQARGQIFAAYRQATGDTPPDELIHFYQSMRACTRATLGMRHLDDPGVGDHDRWRRQASQYLDLAWMHIDHCRHADLHV